MLFHFCAPAIADGILYDALCVAGECAGGALNEPRNNRRASAICQKYKALRLRCAERLEKDMMRCEGGGDLLV